MFSKALVVDFRPVGHQIPCHTINKQIKISRDIANFITNLTLISHPFLQSGIAFSSNYTLTGYHDELFEELNISCPKNIYNAVPKRKAEYLAGRYLSRLLLLANGLPPTNILSGIHRQPLWPIGWTGSITHTHNTVISCLASLSQISLLGIDLEDWIEPSTAQEIAARIIDRKELMLLLPLETYQQRVTLAFSAKESFFKAIYPIVGDHFDFDTVRLVDFKITDSSFTLQLKKTLSFSARDGDLFSGYFNTNEKGVLTLVVRAAAH